MKYIFCAFLLMPSPALAKEFKFTWTMDGGTLKYKINKDTYEKAFDYAAVFCFDFFKKKKPLTEERGLEIIDVCANPDVK
jgi:hypothetical protein